MASSSNLFCKAEVDLRYLAEHLSSGVMPEPEAFQFLDSLHLNLLSQIPRIDVIRLFTAAALSKSQLSGKEADKKYAGQVRLFLENIFSSDASKWRPLRKEDREKLLKLDARAVVFLGLAYQLQPWRALKQDGVKYILENAQTYFERHDLNGLTSLPAVKKAVAKVSGPDIDVELFDDFEEKYLRLSRKGGYEGIPESPNDDSSKLRSVALPSAGTTSDNAVDSRQGHPENPSTYKRGHDAILTSDAAPPSPSKRPRQDKIVSRIQLLETPVTFPKEPNGPVALPGQTLAFSGSDMAIRRYINTYDHSSSSSSHQAGWPSLQANQPVNATSPPTAERQPWPSWPLPTRPAPRLPEPNINQSGAGSQASRPSHDRVFIESHNPHPSQPSSDRRVPQAPTSALPGYSDPSRFQAVPQACGVLSDIHTTPAADHPHWLTPSLPPIQPQPEMHYSLAPESNILQPIQSLPDMRNELTPARYDNLHNAIEVSPAESHPPAPMDDLNINQNGAGRRTSRSSHIPAFGKDRNEHPPHLLDRLHRNKYPHLLDRPHRNASPPLEQPSSNALRFFQLFQNVNFLLELDSPNVDRLKILEVFQSSFVHSLEYIRLSAFYPDKPDSPYRHFTKGIHEVHEDLQKLVASVQYCNSMVISAPSLPDNDVLLSVRLSSENPWALTPEVLDPFKPIILQSATYMATHTLGFTFQLPAYWVVLPLAFDQAMDWAGLPPKPHNFSLFSSQLS